jgi:nucleoside-diphosphate-sugar epimerase
MKVLVTGGAGFLGQMVVAELLKKTALPDARGQPQHIEQIIALDQAPGQWPEQVPQPVTDPRVRRATGDVGDRALLSSLIDATVGGVFHLAAVVSGAAEADFDLGMRVNVAGTQALLQACRTQPQPARLLFASSVAVFGPPLPDVVTDATAPTPQASYGLEKLIAELLVGEYSRKGFVDGRSVRLPTVSVRPGRPNAAASSFASGIIREPVAGVEAICPVGTDTLLWLTSPRQVIASLLHAYELPAAAWGTQRSLNLPGITVSVGDMVEALSRFAGPAAAKLVRCQPDARIKAIVETWPARFDTARASAMGFGRDASIDALIQDYVRTYGS